MASPTDHIALIKEAIKATKEADKLLSRHRTNFPKLRLVRIATESDTGLYHLRARTHRLLGEGATGIPGQRFYDRAQIAAEDAVAEALRTEHRAWEEATTQTLEYLSSFRQRLDNLEGSLSAATKRSNAALERLLREDPSFSRVRLFRDIGVERRRPLKRLEDITAGTAVSDASLLTGTDARQEVIDAFHDEDRIRGERDQLRIDRSEALRDSHEAAQGHIPRSQMATACGLSRSRSRVVVQSE